MSPLESFFKSLTDRKADPPVKGKLTLEEIAGSEQRRFFDERFALMTRDEDFGRGNRDLSNPKVWFRNEDIDAATRFLLSAGPSTLTALPLATILPADAEARRGRSVMDATQTPDENAAVCESLFKTLCKEWKRQHQREAAKCQPGVLCSYPLLVGEGSAIVHAFNVQNNHWVVGALLNLNSPKCQAVVLDSVHNHHKHEPNYHATVQDKLIDFRNHCLLFGNDSSGQSWCENCKNVAGKVPVIEGKNMNVERLSPIVPQQSDTSQCGPMSVLALYNLLHNADFLRYCTLSVESYNDIFESRDTDSFSGTKVVHPYTELDALHLRKYLNEEIEFRARFCRELQVSESESAAPEGGKKKPGSPPIEFWNSSPAKPRQKRKRS